MVEGLISNRAPFSAVVEQFRAGASTPRVYLESCIEAVERLDPALRVFTCTNLPRARELADESTARYREGRALSPIDGMPIGVKDIIDTADMPTQMGSPIFQGHYPKCDAAAVRAIKDGGGIPVGKTVTTEFAMGRSGPTVNPHHPGHTPGGSSSGSAAGTAAGMFAAALGTQTQGSIIRPASYCGVVGYKPTHASLSLDGIHALSASHDHLGAIADSVDDAWWLARWISECAPPQNQPGLSGPLSGEVPAVPLRSVAVLRTRGYEGLDDASAGAFDRALEGLRGRGVRVVEPGADRVLAAVAARMDAVPEMSYQMVAYDMRWPFKGYAEAFPDQLSPMIYDMLERAAAVSRDRYREILAYRNELFRLVASLADTYDAFVLPASSGPAPAGLENTGDRSLLVYSSFLGIPAYSLPLMRVGAMPLGLQLVGFANADYRLTRHAKWLMEKAGQA